MNILVTGASGYIGSHLIQKLLGDRKNVVFAVFRNHFPESVSELKPVISDLSGNNFTSAFPKNIDVAVHLAQSKEYRNFPESVEDIFAVNVRSTQLLLEWCRKNRIKKFIFASSGNVYKPRNKLLKETDICEPAGYYGASKYAAELMVKPYSRFFQTIILRIFGVYGPKQMNMTIPNIINRIKTGKEIILAENTGLYFTPLYIDDCVEMLKRVILGNKEGSDLYNVSGREVVHLGKLVEWVSKSMNVFPVVKKTDDKPEHLMGDSAYFCKDFNFVHSIKIEEGLDRIFKYGNN